MKRLLALLVPLLVPALVGAAERPNVIVILAHDLGYVRAG